jgi:putative ABC transport system substrate-binding protein
MKRREFIALLGGAANAQFFGSIAARAQPRQGKNPRIGIIDDGPIWEPFRAALREAGMVERRDFVFEVRAADGEPERLSAAATDLARLPVDVIATYGTPASRAAKAATSSIPIVAISVGDPVGAGLVRSLARPGGNVTGNTILAPDLGPKRLQLVKEIIPSAKSIALLWNPDNVSNTVILEQMRTVAPGLGLAFTAVEARNVKDIDTAFATLARERPDAVMLTSDPLHQRHILKIIAALNQQGLPSMFQSRDNIAAGGLMSYGASFADLFRGGAGYVLKILQGTKPADLPVQPPERFELVINLKTAKAIGLKISDAVLLRADEVIE